MEYYSSKGKRRREVKQRVTLSTPNQQTITKSSSRDMKSLEKSTTTSNTLITAYDDSDDELGDFVYRTSLTAKRLREQQKQASSTSSNSTTTRRKSSRLKDIKSKEDKEKESISSKPTKSKEDAKKRDSTANKKNDKRVIRSNKRKASAPLADDELCHEVTGNIKRVFRNGRSSLLIYRMLQPC